MFMFDSKLHNPATKGKQMYNIIYIVKQGIILTKKAIIKIEKWIKQ